MVSDCSAKQHLRTFHRPSEEFTVCSDPSEREAILSSFIANSLNAQESSGDPAVVPSKCLDWPTTLNSLATHK
jgi:hypothetical protein